MADYAGKRNSTKPHPGKSSIQMKPKLYIPQKNPWSVSIRLISKNNMVVLHSTELDLYILRLSMVSQQAYSINGIITVGDTYFKNLFYKGVKCFLL